MPVGDKMHDVLFILVIYDVQLHDCTTYRTLSALLSDEQLRDCLYVHDNSQHNIFLSGAYNEGLHQAIRRGKQWVVLLDDDTCLTADYLSSLLASMNGDNDVLVPTLLDNGNHVLSPFYYSSRRGPFYVQSYTARPGYQLSAFNSAAAIRTDMLQRLGGLTPLYPMDYLDYWLFNQLHLLGARIHTLPVCLHHELSITNYATLSPSRYQRILTAEHQFAMDGPWRWRIYYRIRLLLRLLKWTLTGHRYIKQTCKQLLNR